MSLLRESVDEPLAKRRKYCNHCDTYLGKSAFYVHRSKYYDPVTDEWKKEDANEDTSSMDEDGHTDLVSNLLVSILHDRRYLIYRLPYPQYLRLHIQAHNWQ